MDLKKLEWDGMDWFDLAKNMNRWLVSVNSVMNLLGSIKCKGFLN